MAGFYINFISVCITIADLNIFHLQLSLFQRLSSTAPLPANECFAKLMAMAVQLLFWDEKPLPKAARKPSSALTTSPE